MDIKTIYITSQAILVVGILAGIYYAFFMDDDTMKPQEK